MKVLVLGATGGTGREVVKQAVERGHHVTAFVRSPDRLGVQSKSVRVLTGDAAADGSALDDAVRGHDAVISALGVGKSFKAAGTIERSLKALVPAMERSGVSRIVHTSAFGIGVTWRDTPLVPRIFISTLLRGVYADKRLGEELLIASKLRWTIVYPTGLTDGPRTSKPRVGERLPLRGFPTVSRADVASCLLDCVANDASIGKQLLVTS